MSNVSYCLAFLVVDFLISHSKRCFSIAGCPFDPLIKINNAVANVISTLVFGHRYEYDDVQFQKLLRMSAESVYLTGSVWNEVQYRIQLYSLMNKNEVQQLKLGLMNELNTI